eukprot:scaffold59454_cov75-Phaeocystis_antarctica.AAC.2
MTKAQVDQSSKDRHLDPRFDDHEELVLMICLDLRFDGRELLDDPLGVRGGEGGVQQVVDLSHEEHRDAVHEQVGVGTRVGDISAASVEEHHADCGLGQDYEKPEQDFLPSREA